MRVPVGVLPDMIAKPRALPVDIPYNPYPQGIPPPPPPIEEIDSLGFRHNMPPGMARPMGNAPVIPFQNHFY